MDFDANLEVHFYGQDVGSVVVESAGGPDQQYVEVLLYCTFALRQMMNLGDNDFSRGLAGLLVRVKKQIPGFATLPLPDMAQLVEYRGVSGEKRFKATLTCRDKMGRFDLKAEGFGWFGKGLGYFAPASVLLLLRFLAQKRVQDMRYLAWLGRAGASCARKFLEGSVNLRNQAQIAAEETVEAAVSLTGARTEATDVLGSPTAQANKRVPFAHIETTLRERGRQIAPSEIGEAFLPGGSMLSFDGLDEATRIAFHRVVMEQVEFVRPVLPTVCDLSHDAIRLEVGKGVFDGYMFFRVILDTHDQPLSISRGSNDATAKSSAMLNLMESVKPVSLLDAAGDELERYFRAWASTYSRDGVYALVEDQELAAKGLYVAMLNGFSLAACEHELLERPCST